MKFLDFLLSLAALISLLVATYLFATDQDLGKSIDDLAKDRISILNSKSTEMPAWSDTTLGGSGVEPAQTGSTNNVQSSESVPQWKYIIIHHSGTKSGNAKIFDRYHRKEKKFPGGIAYHFVIGNGTKSANGEIEVTQRWHKKIPGPHCFDPKMNEQSIGICLVGNFEKAKPTQTQIRRLAELIREIRKDYDIPLENILGHKDVDPGATDCPGKNFPMAPLKSRLSR